MASRRSSRSSSSTNSSRVAVVGVPAELGRLVRAPEPGVVGRDAAMAGVEHRRDHLAPQIRPGRLAVDEDDRLAVALVDVGEAQAVDLAVVRLVRRSRGARRSARRGFGRRPCRRPTYLTLRTRSGSLRIHCATVTQCVTLCQLWHRKTPQPPARNAGRRASAAVSESSRRPTSSSASARPPTSTSARSWTAPGSVARCSIGTSTTSATSLMRVGREAMDELYDAQVALAEARVEPTPRRSAPRWSPPSTSIAATARCCGP